MSERRPIGVQLFSVHHDLEKNAPATLARVRATGVTAVEPYGIEDDPDWWRDALHAAGLVAPTAHGAVLRDPETVAAAARLIGAETVIDPSVDPDRWRDRDTVRAFAAELDGAARRAADQGVRVGYHNHHDEIRSQIDGVTALEVLAGELDRLDSPAELQLDAYWAAAGGADPVALAERLGPRVTSLHLKDGPGRGGDREQVALGRGDQPLDALLAAAPDARRIIELDTVAGDVFDDLAASVAWLEARA